MPTRKSLSDRMELIELKMKELEMRLDHVNDPPPRAVRTRKRDYDTWYSVTTMFRAGMSRTNICKMFNISMNLCRAYLAMPEAQGRALPRKAEVSKIIFKAKLEKLKEK